MLCSNLEPCGLSTTHRGHRRHALRRRGRLLERNPGARLRLYGQEINDQSYAICKSDMIAKGQDVGNIKLGDTLDDDLFFDRTFDFCMSNPPYGVDWKASQESVKRRR